jgi:predicted nucleotidyltransferase
MNTSVPPHVQPALLNALLPLRDYLRQLYQERFDRLVLFGSQARGEADATSDVDVLIVLHDPVDASQELQHTSEFVAQLCLDHNLLIARLFMPKSRFESENSPFLRNIRTEGIAL